MGIVGGSLDTNKSSKGMLFSMKAIIKDILIPNLKISLKGGDRFC